MTVYSKHFNVRQTHQGQPIPGREQEMVEGHAGGFVFPVDDWTRLDRFLILGSAENTYYASAKTLTIENAQAVVRCLKEDGKRVVERLVEISTAGRAPKNDPALFVLAMACCPKFANVETRRAAFIALPKVARIGTHLFTFLENCKAFRGWGRGLREAVAGWYNGKDPRKLAYQLVKYRQRGGWTHRDALRLAHPKSPGETHNLLYSWVTQNMLPDELGPSVDGKGMAFVYGFELVQRSESKSQVIALIEKYNLTREMIPTQFLKEPDVWGALLEKMPMTAMVRNLANMTRVGLIAPMSDAATTVADRLRDRERLRKARIHPIAVLAALTTYQSGRSGFRARLGGRHREVQDRTWQPVSQVVDALDDAFYLSFGNVQPTGKRTVLALDVSGSMGVAGVAGIANLPARTAACAMAMVTARTEPNHVIVAFSDRMVPFEVSPRERLDDVVRRSDRLAFGRTDCALPMLWALGYNAKPSSGWARLSTGYEKVGRVVEADAFLIYTDSETWFGSIHPTQALQRYRRETGIGAKLVVVGMVSSGFSIADPSDGGMLDVVGFDTASPNLISDFVGRVRKEAPR